MTEAAKPEKNITITVNNKPVTFHSAEVNGLQIKEAAIAQGVDIQLDFQLWEEAHGGHEMRSIADDEPVKIHNNLEFTCNTGDHDS
jgi:hypothetical protein